MVERAAARRPLVIAWLAQCDLPARNRAVWRGGGRCRDNWRQSTLTALNALSGPASAQLGFFLAEVFEGVVRLRLVWLNVPIARKCVGQRLIFVPVKVCEGRTRPEQNAPKQSKKPSQASQGALGARRKARGFDSGFFEAKLALQNRASRAARCGVYAATVIHLTQASSSERKSHGNRAARRTITDHHFK